jgi:hypothetical protein
MKSLLKEIIHLVVCIRALRTALQSVRYTYVMNTNVTNGNLHFRRLGLDQAELLTLIGEVEETLKKSSQELNSLSLSYNHILGDIGLIKILEFLPPDLKDLGLVGCGIGDAGIEKLLEWIESATDLEMLCIEKNHFSSEMSTQLQRMSHVKGFRLFT